MNPDTVEWFLARYLRQFVKADWKLQGGFALSLLVRQSWKNLCNVVESACQAPTDGTQSSLQLTQPKKTLL